jgi:hypothetical protein
VAQWVPRSCRRCGTRPIAGRVGDTGSYGKKGYLCWWCAFAGRAAPPCKVCGSDEFWTAGYCSNCHPRVRCRSCIECFSWGSAVSGDGRRQAFVGGVCRGCYKWKLQTDQRGRCRFCRRTLPLRSGACRLCHAEAHRRAGAGDHHRVLRYLEADPAHQLFLAGMLRNLGRKAGSGAAPVAEPGPWSPPDAVQMQLFEQPRDLTLGGPEITFAAADERVAHACRLARRLGEQRGWAADTIGGVVRAVTVALTGQPDDGNPVRYRDLTSLARRGLPVARTSEVLASMGLLLDDRLDPLQAWIGRRLADLDPRIGAEVGHWTMALRGCLPRTRRRDAATVRRQLAYLLPALTAWSQRYDSLREVTRQDIETAIGNRAESLENRKRTLTALRSLFALLKRDRRIFHNPTNRLALPAVGARTCPQPLADDQLRAAVTWARSRPERQMLVALAAAQAFLPAQMLALRLDDVDLGDRLMFIDGWPYPLHALTYRALVDYLTYRRDRWPDTANPYLLITQQTAVETGPASRGWHKRIMRPLGITLEQLRHDRLLDELRAHGPDPLHFQAVFGCSTSMAIEYAAITR